MLIKAAAVVPDAKADAVRLQLQRNVDDIHVTTHPSEALVRKCGDNLKAGLKPLIITLAEAVKPAQYLLKAVNIADRVDVLDTAQFLMANVYERSFFKTAECKVTFTALLTRYNAIVTQCETDPSLWVRIS